MYKTQFHTTDISNKTFLITGGAGFIGSNIVEYLLKYKAGTVIVLDNLSTGFKENLKDFLALPNFTFIEGDICDLSTCQKACAGVDFVFHQAALGSVPRSVNNPIATNNVNVNGFINILLAARDNKVKRIVYASSSSVYGDNKDFPKVEEKTGNLLSPYAVTKRANELYADVFNRVYGIEITGLRYFNIFGPRQNPKGEYAAALPLFMQAILNNESPFINGDGEQSRDFTFIENAVQANIKAMFSDKKEGVAKVYNVAVGEKISINKLFDVLKKIADSTVNAKHRENRPGDIRDSLADISKAKKDLGYNPQVHVEDGLKTTFEWFKKYFGAKQTA